MLYKEELDNTHIMDVRCTAIFGKYDKRRVEDTVPILTQQQYMLEKFKAKRDVIEEKEEHKRDIIGKFPCKKKIRIIHVRKLWNHLKMCILPV